MDVEIVVSRRMRDRPRQQQPFVHEVLADAGQRDRPDRAGKHDQQQEPLQQHRVQPAAQAHKGDLMLVTTGDVPRDDR